jgi:pimeloyl-ACP methyl ester carboxylesterase
LLITGTGTEYNAYVPLTNSLIIAEKIPGVWLVQIKDAGHAVMSQYPDKINKVYYQTQYENQNNKIDSYLEK